MFGIKLVNFGNSSEEYLFNFFISSSLDVNNKLFPPTGHEQQEDV